MPYIDDDARIWADAYGPSDRDSLAYTLARILVRYIHRHGLSDQTTADCLAACETIKLELYRRVTGPVQDIRLTESGDISPRWS